MKRIKKVKKFKTEGSKNFRTTALSDHAITSDHRACIRAAELHRNDLEMARRIFSAANYYGSCVVAYAFRGWLRTLRKLKQTTRMRNSEVHFSCKKIDNYSVLALTKRSAMRPVSFSALRAHRGESSVASEDSQYHRHTLESSFLPDTYYCPLHLSRVR